MYLLTGQVLHNRYRIDRLLGQDSFGAVYLAWDQNLDGRVVIKESTHVSPASNVHFQSEVRQLARLRHPNLPIIHDGFIIPEQGCYLVADYVEGEDLAGKLERQGGPLPVEQVLEWIRPICDALDFLHCQVPPIYHCDLKPANIIIAGSTTVQDKGPAPGRPYLVDFGLARTFERQFQATPETRVLSPGYSPPEQYGPGAVDERSDVYALGATLYHLLTGHRLPAAIDLASGAVPPPAAPRAVNPAVPLHTSRAIMLALQLDRSQRWKNVASFKLALGVPAGPWPELAPGASQVERLELDRTLEASPTDPATAHPAGRLSRRRILAGCLGIFGGLFLLVCLATAGLGLYFMKDEFLPGFSFDLFPSSHRSPPSSNPFRPLPTRQAPFDPAAATARYRTLQAIATSNALQAGAGKLGTPRPTSTDAPQPGQPWPRPADGMEMVYIPVGAFQMGSTGGDHYALEDEKPQRLVYLDSYWIDRSEVTLGMFRRFVKAAHYTWEGAYSGAEARPVVNVTWADADAYCAWAGAHLPSEAQWEKAARGNDGWLYPWGNQPAACRLAVMALAPDGCGYQAVALPGSLPDGTSPYGLLDMAGNAWEWVQDWYDPAYYPAAPARSPLGPLMGEQRVLRGGAWSSPAGLVRAAARGHADPLTSSSEIGFRCAH